MTDINHHPIFPIEKVIEHYSKKDGVPVSYVCTSSLNEGATWAADIFYRATPHPEFGNRYFALYHNPDPASDGRIVIAGADKIEELEFAMMKGEDGWEYSQHRHDFRNVPGSGAIDGGRAYVKVTGDPIILDFMKVRNGEFVEGDP